MDSKKSLDVSHRFHQITNHKLILIGLLCLLPFLLLSCTKIVPLSTDLTLPPDRTRPKVNKKICISMNKSLYNKTVKKYAQYKFDVGKSIMINLTNILNELFSHVSTSIEDNNCNSDYGYVVKTDLIEDRYDISATLRGEHKVFLKMKFDLYDAEDNLLFTHTPQCLGTNTMNSKDQVKHIAKAALLPIMFQTEYRRAMGTAFDNALAGVLDEFIVQMKKAINNKQII